MLFTLILAQAVLYSNSLVSACWSLGPDGCRRAPGAGQSEARGTGRPLCTLSAGGSQPNGNLSMIQPQPHMKPNSLSARTINKDKPHSADHPGSLYCYWAAPNCSLNTPPLGVFTHIYIEASTTEMWNGVQCLFQVASLHKNIIYAFPYSAYRKIRHNSHYYSAVVRGCSASLVDNINVPQRKHLWISIHITIYYLSPTQVKI